MNTAALIMAGATVAAVLGVGLLLLTVVSRVQEKRLARRYWGERGNEAGRGQRSRSAWVEGFTESGERVNKALSDPHETHVLFAQAGWRDARSRAVFYAFQFLSPVVAGLIALVLFGSFGWLTGSALGPLMLLMVVILALLAPRYILRSRAKKRREAIRREIPLFINVLVLLFESGLNLRQALTSLVRDGSETLPNLVDEFRPILRQIEAGADADNLLHETGKVLAIDELDTVLGILRQVERYGGEIREPLLETLDELQEKRYMELREQVNVLSGKMTVVLVTCFLPPLLIFIAGPAVMSISSALGNI